MTNAAAEAYGLSGYVSVAQAAGDITNYVGPSALTSTGPGTSTFLATVGVPSPGNGEGQNVVLTQGIANYWLNTGSIAGIVYGTLGASGAVPNGIDSYGNDTGNTGTVTTVGTITTIDLPIYGDISEHISTGSGSVTLDIILTGQIVASVTSIPEPSTLVLASVGLVSSLLVVAARRRKRKA